MIISMLEFMHHVSNSGVFFICKIVQGVSKKLEKYFHAFATQMQLCEILLHGKKS